MERLPSSPIYSNDGPNEGPQPSPEPERILTPRQPKLVSFNDTTQTLSTLIANHYDVFPQFPVNFAVVNSHIFKVVLLGEDHGNDEHAVANARVVDHLWKLNAGRLLLFTEDGAKSREPIGQARFVLPEIGVQRWDQLERAEVDEAYQNLFRLSVQSVREMNEVFKVIEHLQNVLSKVKNLDMDANILNLNTNSFVPDIDVFNNYIDQLSAISNKCLNVFFDISGKIDAYASSVKVSTVKRDQFLHALIQETLIKHHNFKLCIISGRRHTHPALDYLKQHNAALALVPKETKEVEKKIEAESFNILYNEIHKTVKVINDLKSINSNIEVFSISVMQLKLFNKMMTYVDFILKLHMEAKTL